MKATPFAPVDVWEFMRRNTKQRPAIIEGVLRRGEVANLIAPPKLGKSWLVQSLALAVASGRRWLETFEVHPVPVLHLDNELQPETLGFRFRSLTNAMKLDQTGTGERLKVVPMRGCAGFEEKAVSGWCRERNVGLIIVDALYRLASAWGLKNENDNAEVTAFYDRIGALAQDADAAVLLVHHTSKGSQAGKDLTDVGAGAGAHSRAPDVHLVLRRHVEDCAAVLAGEVRDWSPLKARCFRRHANGLWVPVDLDVTRLHGGTRPRERVPRPAPVPMTVDALVTGFLSEAPKDVAAVVAEAKAAGWDSVRAINDVIRQGKASGRIFDHRRGNNKPSILATVPVQVGE